MASLRRDLSPKATVSGRGFLFPLTISLSDIVSRERENNTGPIAGLH